MGGVRHKDGVRLIQALERNCGNLSLRCQGRNPRGRTPRMRVPMRKTGAEQPVVAKKFL